MSLTLTQMTDHVADVTGFGDAAGRETIARFLRRRYTMLWDAQLWDDAKTVFVLTTAAPEVILPAWVDRVLAVKTLGPDARLLDPMEVTTIWQICPRAYEDAGETQAYSELPPVAVHTHPNGATLTLVSSAGGDRGEVRVRGIHNGLEVDETITLSGMSYVQSVNYFDEISTLSKGTTTGYVTIKAVFLPTREVQVLLPHENERRHLRLRLHRALAEPVSLTVVAKRVPRQLLHGQDTPELSGCENLLIAYAVSDVWEKLRQVAKAQVKLQETAGLMAALVTRDVLQKARVVRLVPESDVYA